MPDENGMSTADRIAAALAGSGAAITPPETPVTTPPVAESDPVATGGHPAWQEVLGLIPESLHESIIPALKKWDDGVAHKLSTVHSEFEPYKDILAGMDPESVASAIQIANLMENDPYSIYSKLPEVYGESEAWKKALILQQGQAATGGNVDDSVDLSDENPVIAQLQAQQQQILSTLEKNEALKAENEANQWLEGRLTAMQEEFKAAEIPYSDRARDMILAQASAIGPNVGNDGDKALTMAIDAYKELVGGFIPAKTPGNAPMTLPAGGKMPSTQFDPAKMSPADTRKLVAQMIQSASGSQ